MREPGTGENKSAAEGPPKALNLLPEQRDGYQRQLKGILDSGDSAVEDTKKTADEFADDQWNNTAQPLNRFDRLAGIQAEGIRNDVRKECNKVNKKGIELKEGWSQLVVAARNGVPDLTRNDLKRAEVEDIASSVLGQINNRRAVISQEFPDLGQFISNINRSLRGVQEVVGRIYLDAPDVADQADQIGEFKKELGRLLDHNDPKLAGGRQFTESHYQKIMDISGEIRKLFEAIAEARLASPQPQPIPGTS